MHHLLPCHSTFRAGQTHRLMQTPVSLSLMQFLQSLTQHSSTGTQSTCSGLSFSYRGSRTDPVTLWQPKSFRFQNPTILDLSTECPIRNLRHLSKLGHLPAGRSPGIIHQLCSCKTQNSSPVSTWWHTTCFYWIPLPWPPWLTRICHFQELFNE